MLFLNVLLIMNKVVYNTCYGGFGLSELALRWLMNHGFNGDAYLIERHNPLLVQCVEELGDEANAEYSELAIAKISGNKYIIENYDGSETVLEPDDIMWTEIN